MSDVIVLAGADERDLTQLTEYRAVGGYDQLERARGLAPAAIIEELNTANLRGRGGAFFPAGRKMQFIPSMSRFRSRTTSASTPTSRSPGPSRTARS